MERRARWRLASSALALLAATPAAAQSTAPPAAAASGCGNADSARRVAPVFLLDSLTYPAAPPATLVTSVDLFTQTLATTVRESLGGTGPQLPSADSVMSAGSLMGTVRVVARKDGSFDFALVPARRDGPAIDSRGIERVARGLATMRQHAETFFWDEEIPGDSVVWLASLRPAEVSRDGTWRPLAVRAGIPAFSLMETWTEEVSMDRVVRPRYPYYTREEGFSGTIIARFVVDTAGSSVPSTISFQPPAGLESLAARNQRAYRDFVDAVRVSITQSRYHPALIGGCRVRQMITQPFTFELR